MDAADADVSAEPGAGTALERLLAKLPDAAALNAHWAVAAMAATTAGVCLVAGLEPAVGWCAS